MFKLRNKASFLILQLLDVPLPFLFYEIEEIEKSKAKALFSKIEQTTLIIEISINSIKKPGGAI